MKNIIAFQDFSYLYRNQPKPNREKEEFRLLRIIHNVDTRKIELVCYKFDSIIIAVMPELFYDRVKPLINKTIGLEFERKEIGNHQILMINQIILHYQHGFHWIRKVFTVNSCISWLNLSPNTKA